MLFRYFWIYINHSYLVSQGMIDQVDPSLGCFIFIYALRKMFEIPNHRNCYSRFFAELQARVALTITPGVSVIDLRFS